MKIDALYRQSRHAALLGVAINLALGVFKLLGGWNGDSAALISDAVHSLGDALVAIQNMERSLAKPATLTARYQGSARVFETSLAGVVEIRDFANRPVCRFDFPASVERSQTPRQDYFVNFKFYLPPMPEGRYTLHVLVKDVLAPVGDDATPRRAIRSLDFSVGGARRAGRE